MDAEGIDVAVLSINPNWYDTDRDLAAHVITVQNDSMSSFCAAHPDRFTAFASVALPPLNRLLELTRPTPTSWAITAAAAAEALIVGRVLAPAGNKEATEPTVHNLATG